MSSQHENALASASNAGKIIGGSIAVGVLIIAFAIFAIIVFGELIQNLTQT